MTEPVFADNAPASRYELREQDKVIAFADYRLRGQRITFTHTEVDTTREGRGMGSLLAREAFADAQRRGLQIVTTCPFMTASMARHPPSVLRT